MGVICGQQTESVDGRSACMRSLRSKDPLDDPSVGIYLAHLAVVSKAIEDFHLQTREERGERGFVHRAFVLARLCTRIGLR